MLRIILSLQLTVILFTALSVEEPQLVEELQLEEEPVSLEDGHSKIKLTAERFGPPSNAQFVALPVVPIPGHLAKPGKRPVKVTGPPHPPKRKPLRKKPTKRPKPITTRPITGEIKPLPITVPPISSTPVPATPDHIFTTARPVRSTRRPIRVSTTPKPQKLTSTLPLPVIIPPLTTEKPLAKPYRRPVPPTTTTVRPTGPVPLVYSTHVMEDDGSYYFDFLAENSVQRTEWGLFKTVDGVEFPVHFKIGNYSFTSPEGVKYIVGYVADENGYRATTDV